MSFDHLGLIEPLLHAVRFEGYITPTAIQKQAIPPILEGKDLLGCAQTGTGKTAAFALPILQRLSRVTVETKGLRPIRALILAPTRELAAQIGESFAAYGRHTGLRHTVIFGGVSQGPQDQALRAGVDIVVATPGRLLDLIGQRRLVLRHVEVFVLDEADRMLDMGFIGDIRRVVAQIPSRRQTLLFSATIPQAIRSLADTLLSKPVQVRVSEGCPAPDTVEQGLYFVAPTRKPALLEHLLKDPALTRTLVFTRTKRGADRVARHLVRADIATEAIHSNKSQNARMRALASFKKGAVRVLAASDIAARGLDVDDISHVINYDLPGDAETYVHRIGRTGRAGALGRAISFCSEDQRDLLRDIERLLGRSIPVLRPAISLDASAGTDRHRPDDSRKHGVPGGGRKTSSASQPVPSRRKNNGSRRRQRSHPSVWDERRARRVGN
jgi:ATP-dependent RNA helicase RhlE